MDAAQKALKPLAVAAVVAALALVAGVVAPRAAAPAASRVVSIVPAVTEMLFAMGAGDAVAGVSSYDHFPPAVESRPRVGALLDPNFERILTLKPDLVVVYGTQKEFIAKLEQAKIPIYRYEHAGLADILTTVRSVGARIGRAEAGHALAASMTRELDAVRRQVAGRPRPKTLLLFGRDKTALRNLWASGGYGFLHDLLDLAGGDDLFADVLRQSVQTNTEQVLARGPEVILELHDTMTAGEMAAARALWAPLGAVPAVRQGRIHMLTGDYLTVPGPRVVDAARAMAAALHPGAVR